MTELCHCVSFDSKPFYPDVHTGGGRTHRRPAGGGFGWKNSKATEKARKFKKWKQVSGTKTDTRQFSH